MISTYIIPENTDFTVFISPVVTNMIIAKDNLGAAYLPEWNFNGIGDLLQGQGYQVKMSSSEVLVVEGVQIQPEENPIDLNEGWNMIAYLRTEAVSADLVFANLVEAASALAATRSETVPKEKLLSRSTKSTSDSTTSRRLTSLPSAV